MRQYEVLRLDSPLSPWGGLDPLTGKIVDERHPQHGACIADRILVLPGSVGSTSGPSVLADCLRRGTGPVAIMLEQADSTLMVAVWVAETLYGSSCRILSRPRAQWPESGSRMPLPASDGTTRS
jgi:predicted aconitase with swiveling domain